eukprot:scaffold110540_cov66-Phaeocystis_antarctica.AAC.2
MSPSHCTSCSGGGAQAACWPTGCPMGCPGSDDLAQARALLLWLTSRDVCFEGDGAVVRGACLQSGTTLWRCRNACAQTERGQHRERERSSCPFWMSRGKRGPLSSKRRHRTRHRMFLTSHQFQWTTRMPLP